MLTPLIGPAGLRLAIRQSVFLVIYYVVLINVNCLLLLMEVRLLVGRNVRRLRVQKGISQDELAHIADIERAYIGYLERGARNPTVTTLAKLAEALGVGIKAFFDDVDLSDELTPLPPGRKKGGRQS